MRRFVFLFVLMAGAAASSASCTASLGLEGRSCPCADGFTCCAASGTCVAGGPEACPAMEAGSTAEAGPSSDASSPPDVAEAAAAPPPPGTLLADKQSPHCLALDADHVFWQNTDTTLAGIPKTGGTLWRTSGGFSFQTWHCALQIDGDRAYAADHFSLMMIQITWTTSGGYGSYGAFGAPTSVVLDDLWLYLTDYNNGRLLKVSKWWGTADAGPDGGGPFVLTSGLLHPDAIAFDGDDFVWIDRGTDPAGVSSDGAIKRMPKAGGTVTTVLGGQTRIDSFVVHDGNVYFVDPSGLHSVGAHGGAPVLVAPSVQARSLVANASALYWISSAGLERLPFGSSQPKTLYGPPLDTATALVVDDAYVFWTMGDQVRYASNQ